MIMPSLLFSGAMNLAELRPFERDAFFNYKEEVYRGRRDLVAKYCQYLEQQSGDRRGLLNIFVCFISNPKYVFYT